MKRKEPVWELSGWQHLPFDSALSADEERTHLWRESDQRTSNGERRI
jgi:hypothetical protein